MRPLGRWIILAPFWLIVLECWLQIFNQLSASCKWSMWNIVGLGGRGDFCFVAYMTFKNSSVPAVELNWIIAGGWFVIGSIFFIIVIKLHKKIPKTPSTPKLIPSTPQSDDVKIQRTSYKPAETKESESNFCENCGKSLKPEAKFCGKCGTSVP